MLNVYPMIDENGKISCKKAGTFSLALTFYTDNPPVTLRNFTGCSAKLVVKNAAGTAVLTFDSTASPVTITLGGALGTLTLSQTSVTMAALTAGEYVYDLRITGSGGAVEFTQTAPFSVIDNVTS